MSDTTKHTGPDSFTDDALPMPWDLIAKAKVAGKYNMFVRCDAKAYALAQLMMTLTRSRNYEDLFTQMLVREAEALRKAKPNLFNATVRELLRDPAQFETLLPKQLQDQGVSVSILSQL